MYISRSMPENKKNGFSSDSIQKVPLSLRLSEYGYLRVCDILV